MSGVRCDSIQQAVEGLVKSYSLNEQANAPPIDIGGESECGGWGCWGAD